MNTALTIAGSDCSGGAGIQADLKTFMAFGVYGMSALTAVVAENTVGVQAVFDLPVELIVEQIRSVMDDIPADAVKVGMLSSPAIVNAVAGEIERYHISKLVVDPVMVAKSGDPLLSEDARGVLRDVMLPLATVITPNLHEAQVLLGAKIETVEQMKEAARELKKFGSRYVVVKGGHLTGGKEAVDVMFDGSKVELLSSPFIETPNTHGTGCTFSSAIAAGMAKGMEVQAAVRKAKAYISAAIEQNVRLGHGHGPTNHLAGVESRW